MELMSKTTVYYYYYRFLFFPNQSRLGSAGSPNGSKEEP